MVDINNIDRHALADAAQAYPWFAAARAQLCMDMAAHAGVDAAIGLLAESLPFLPDGAYIYRRMRSTNAQPVYKDSNLTAQIESRDSVRPKIHVAGMDFFSKEDYESAHMGEDDRISSMAVVDYSAPAPEMQTSTSTDNLDLVSETLAEIFANQGYPERAKEIYTRLSFENPEKSAYFASLIDNLK